MIATADAAQTAAAIRAIGAAILDLLDAADEMDAVIADAPEEHRLRARAVVISTELAAQRMAAEVAALTGELRAALQAWSGSRW